MNVRSCSRRGQPAPVFGFARPGELAAGQRMGAGFRERSAAEVLSPVGRVGRRVGAYRTDAEIGRGGMGTVSRLLSIRSSIAPPEAADLRVRLGASPCPPSKTEGLQRSAPIDTGGRTRLRGGSLEAALSRTTGERDFGRRGVPRWVVDDPLPRLLACRREQPRFERTSAAGRLLRLPLTVVLCRGGPAARARAGEGGRAGGRVAGFHAAPAPLAASALTGGVSQLHRIVASSGRRGATGRASRLAE